MPGVKAEDDQESPLLTNGGGKNGDGSSHRKSKSDDSASFLRAARGGNTEKVLEYLKNGTDINTCNANGLNALHLASKEGHVHIVQDLLARGAKIDSATKKGNTALHIASLAGQHEVVKILVSHSASVNVQSQNGFTPLYMAAQENHDEVVRFLLASGASQSLATEDGFTPLAVALQQGHDKVVAVLLENDTRGKVRLPALHIAAKKDDTKAAALLLQNDHNPDVTSKSGFTPLHIAAHYGNENIAVVLLQRGADVNYSAKHNITPLHVAAKWGKGNMVGLLLDKGANLEARTRDGLTPLHCAARSGHENVVDMMLQRGAPISAKTKNGLAPLHMASQGDHVDAARILLHHKAPVDEVTVDYLTALHVAAHCGHVRVAKLLLDRKADPNSRALNGFTPLHIACKKNRIKVVELLLKYGASIEATTESGLTPLHVASFMGCMNIVIFLIQHQASPDEATVRGETPLHLAARANQTDIIRILLRNGAKVDARAREQQTPLHIASRLGNVDIVVLLLASGAQVDAVTKDLYTALHIAAKEGQEEVASILMDHGASMSAATKKGFTPLHLSAKYGNMKVAKLLIAKDAPVDAEGKNGVTPLHVAVHYDNQNVAMLLLDKSASPHACAKNGYTPLHISAKKNQLDIAKTLLDYGAKVDAESKAGFSPLHLAGQEGHIEIASLLIRCGADVNAKAKNGLTPIHLCAQEDKIEVAQVLVENGADCDAETKAGYTPLHVAAHFGQMNMVKFLLGQDVRVDVQNELGYSPLHQAAQQGHSQIVNLLLDANASPNTISNNGQTALSIAQKLGYISVVETLKVVTDTVVTTTTTTTVEEKYKVLAPESMQETFMSDSEDEGGEEPTNDQSYKYLTTEEMLKIPDDSMPMDITSDTNEKKDSMNRSIVDPAQLSIEQTLIRMENSKDKPDFGRKFDDDYKSDNVALSVPPVSAGFLVSFMVDARGGAMRGCRHSGVRVIIPPRKAPMPMRVTCRYLKKDKLIHPPPLMEGEAIASRVLELGPAGAKFLGPVIIEVPHFASLRGKEREIVILRSDNGESWREHTLEATEEAVQDVLQDSFDEGETTQLEDLNTNRITRILTTDFPQYFAIISRIRQEVHAIGPEGGVVNSTVVPQVQAVFPQGALTKKIKVGLQAQPIPPELTAKLLGNRVAVSPIVTVEPRRRKFHKPITLTIPVPVAASKGMINQYSGDTPTLRLLCSITGGTTRAQWEDVTGSTPLTFVNDCVNFTTTVSARFWLMDCRNVAEATKMATTLYKEAIHVPFMAKFCVFSKRHELLEARMRVFCMTDDKEDKTLEHQEHFHEVAKSRDVEVLEGKTHHLEFFGNLFPVTKSGDQLSHKFHAFRENRLPFSVRVKDPNNDALGRISFFREPKQAKGEAQQTSICNLNISLPDDISPEPGNVTDQDMLAIQAKYSFLREAGYGKFDTIHRADLRVSDISNLLGSDWVKLARELEIDDQDINLIISEYPDNVGQQAMVMLRLWLNTEGNKATGNALEKALKKCDRQDIVNKCMFNIEMVTDNAEQELAQSELAREEGYDAFKKELSPLNNSTLKPLTRDYSIDVNVDESEYAHDNGYVAAERLAGITEEISSRSDTINETSLKQEEATSVYEREEQKYVAEEKEFASSYHKEVQQEQMSTNQIMQSQVLETTQRENNIITERTENRNDYVHEEMKKMSIEEKQSMKVVDGGRVMEKTTESKMEEEHKEKEMYNNEMSETKQSKTEEREDGTVLILTDTTKQSREEFMTESHDSRHYEQAEILSGVEPFEVVRVTESNFQSETFDEGLEEQFSANVEQKIVTAERAGTTSPSQPRPASSSFDDEDSEPESPRSPSPKVSPGSKSPSPRVSLHNSHPDLLRQTSSPYGGSSGASSHGSSKNDLDVMPHNDVAPLMKETDQELLDEMIVKDVPESESSTDPVKKFEEAHPSASIDSIQEDQEDASDSECKDQSLNILALATSTPHKSHDTLSLNKSSSEPSPEMTNESEIKDEDDKSPVTSGLAAPDSKDSLEVQLYSNCEDLSENFSGREESIDDIKQRPESSESEDEREPTVNEKVISPVIELVEFKIDNATEKKESFEIIETTTDLMAIKEESGKSVESEQKHSEDSSDEEYDIVSKTEIEEANKQPFVQQQKAQINIQSASSSDTESESDDEKSRHSSADHSETSENKDVGESQDEAPFTTINKDSPVILRSQKVSTNITLKAESTFSRPSSSDYSDIEHHPEVNQDIAAASVKDKISIFNQEVTDVESKTSRPSSSDVSETVDKKTVIESDTEGNSDIIEDLIVVQSVKDKISKFNIEPTVSTDTEPRYSRPSSSDYSEIYEKQTKIEPKKDEFIEKEELVTSTESVKDRISKFNFESTMSSETEPEIEKRHSRPSSSDFSETYDKQPIVEPKKEVIYEKKELVQPIESVKDKISKFNLESTMSSETEPEFEEKHTRQSSSDYSDMYDKQTIIEPKKEEIFEKEELVKPVESVKDRISKFNLDTAMSSETEPELEERHSRPSSSDYSDIHEKKAVFESKENSTNNVVKSTDMVIVSATSSDTEPEPEHKLSRPSSSDYSEICDNKLTLDHKNEDISEATEHTDTVVVQSVKEKVKLESGTSTDTEPRQSRRSSSDYSDIYDKEKIIEEQIEEQKAIVLESTKQEFTEATITTEERAKFEPGILQVTIYKAMDLVNQDMLGKSDPYVKLQFRGQEFRSKTINNSLAPEWNFSTDLLISEVYDSNIIIEVYDEDYGQDNFEGSLSLSLSDAINKPNQEGEWYTLSNCKQGKIFVSTIYTAMSSSQGSLKAFAKPDIEISRPRSYSTSSSSSEEGLTQDQTKVLQQSSTDSSISNRKDKSNQEIQRQEAIDIDDKIAETKPFPLKTQSSSDYSDTDGEQKRKESSSEYDSVSNRGKRRPDSFISDTSSDYDSLSNVGSRRPQSFILDDEYDIITEEEAAESEKQATIETAENNENDTSSSSESEGPDAKEARKHVEVISPPDVQKASSIEDKEHDGEFNGISVPQTLDLPYPNPSSVASSSPILSSDLHAEQSSISVEVDKSTVINSNTLEEIDPLVRDFENISHSNNLTKNIDAKTEKRNIVEEPKVASSGSFQSTSRRSSSSCSSLDQAQRDGSSESERSQDLGTIDTEENDIPTKPLTPQSVKLPEGEDEISPSFEKVSVKNMQDIFEGISKSSVSTKATLKPDSSVEQSSDSNTTVRQIKKHQDSTATDSSDCEISSLHERQKSDTSSSESEVCNVLKRSGTDSSDYEIHSTIYLQKGTDSLSPDKQDYEKTDVMLLSTDEPEKPELSPKEKATFEAFVKPSLDESEDVVHNVEHKPMPLKKQLQKINSTDLLHRQIKEDMYEQVMSQEDDSVMSESTIENNIFQQTSEFADSMHKIEEKFLDSAISLGRTPSSNDALECDSLAEYDVPLPLKTDSDSSISVQQAVENEIEEPEWELVEAAEAEKNRKESAEPISKRSMTPEQALEIATEIVQNVQTEAIRKYEELIKTNQLPKPLPDSKFTPETKEKVQEYLKELEESEQYDVVAAELINKVVSKKEERLKHIKHHDISVDITDDDEHKSESMLNEMRNELRRNSISVTDEDLTTELTHELLQEKNIEEMKKHLEDSRENFVQMSDVPTDFRFQTAFRSHFVKGNEESAYEFESSSGKNQESEDIWAEESKVVFRRDLKTLKDKKSDNDSNSSGSKQNLKNISDRRSGTDQEGYSSSGETYFSTAEHQTQGTISGQSRPTSSDMDAMLSAVSERSMTTTENTEFLSAQDHSLVHDQSSADTSHYFTAGSSLSSHASVKSSESSGHLGSIEVSECSETLVESSLEYEQRLDDGSDTPAGIRPFEEVSFEEFEAVGRNSLNRYSMESSSSTEQSRHSVEFNTAKRITHMRSSSSSSIQPFDISPQEIQCLAEDDVDGCCFSTIKDEDEEKQSLLPDHRFPIPDILASRFSESRETLSSSVLTLSSVSEATIIGQDPRALNASQLSLNPFMDPCQKTSDLLTSSITTLSSSTHSSWSTNVIPSPPKTDNNEIPSSYEELPKDELDEQDQLFPMPRVRSFEGTHSVHVPFPQQMSVDLGSEFDSRPNSELKDVESRPLSTDRMSRTSSNEALHGMTDKRSYSIDETVSDNLRVFEPFIRPKSPMPQSSFSSESGRQSSESEDRKLRISFTAPIRAVSPSSVQPRQCLQSTESFETEIAFSKHFTQVFDDNEFESNEIIKTNDDKAFSTVVENVDLTPESVLTSDSIETSQGEEYIVHPEHKAVSPKPNFDLDDQDDLLVGSPPMVSRPLGVKYWPPVDNLDQDLDALGPMDKRSITRSESDDNSESRLELDNDMIEKEVEDGKRWLESQFDGTQQDEYGQFGYGQPLDQILEEEEDRYSHSSEDVKELQRFKESLSSTPDFDQIINKRHQMPRSGDQDDISMGSLTEFERLEREVGLESVSGSGSHGSLGSNDSLEVCANGNGAEKLEKTGSMKTNLAVKIINHSKSGTGDDVSVSSYNSVRSFELMEAACKEAEQIEIKAKQQEEVLSEIEEGHESQDSESAETISDCEEEKSDKDYEDRLFEIDSIIKQAQANVEKFDKDKKPADQISLRDIMGRPESRTESIHSNDSLDCTKLPDLPKEETPLRRQSSMPTRIQSGQASRTTSVTSLQSMTSVTSIASVSTLTQFDADSIRERDLDLDDLNEAGDLMQASVDSLDQRGKSPDNTMITSTDSLEGTQKRQDNMTISTDSIETGNGKKDMMTVSLDSLDGIAIKEGTMERKKELPHDYDGATSILITSTDSLESSSTNTRATASMLSSMTSQGSETLVADDEFEHDDEDSRSVRKFLIDQGNLQLDDSDDSATYSYSSPQMQHRVFQKDLSDVTVTKFQIKDGRFGSLENFGSSEEILETEEIDEKGNIIVKKVIQKRIFQEPKKVRVTDRKQEGYVSDVSEKRDDSCEETIEEIDEFGKRRRYVVKRTIEQPKPETLGIVHERRQQKGLSPIGEIFKSVTDTPQQSKIEAKRQPIHHTERMTKVFDAPPSTPSPPASPPSSSFRSQIPIRKH